MQFVVKMVKHYGITLLLIKGIALSIGLLIPSSFCCQDIFQITHNFQWTCLPPIHI